MINLARKKNKNGNPVAEKAVQEFKQEKLKFKPRGGALNNLERTLITASLNQRVRGAQISAREIVTTRDQNTGAKLAVDDDKLAADQLARREANHPVSAKSKVPGGTVAKPIQVWPGALVTIKRDKDKNKAREKYLVLELDKNDPHVCKVKKFENQCRKENYIVKITEIELCPNQVQPKRVSDDQDVTVDSPDEQSDAVLASPPIQTPSSRPLPQPFRSQFPPDPGKERSTTPYNLRNVKRRNYEESQLDILLVDKPTSESFYKLPPRYGWVSEDDPSSDSDDQEHLAADAACASDGRGAVRPGEVGHGSGPDDRPRVGPQTKKVTPGPRVRKRQQSQAKFGKQDHVPPLTVRKMNEQWIVADKYLK